MNRKSTILLLLLFVFEINLFSQTINNSIYTPKGSLVSDTYDCSETLSQTDKYNIGLYFSNKYPLATEVSPLSSSTTYNCHGYAWYMYQGNSSPVWMGYYTSSAEDIYWTDGSFIQTSNISEASVVSYSGDNHSGVVRNATTIRSKWGYGPLVEHSIGYGPYYNMSSYNLYKLNFVISGPSTVCSSSTVSYSISGLPNGATVDWVSGTGLTRTSAQGANPCNFSVSGSGDTYVAALINYYGSYYTVPSFSVNILSLPVPSTPTMNVVGANGGQGNYHVAVNSSPVYFTLSGGGGYSYGWYTDDITSSFSITGNALDLYPDVVDFNMISGYVYNTCHQSQTVNVYLEVTGNKSSQSTNSLTLSPNPANDYVDIAVTFDSNVLEPNSYTVEIINSRSYPVKTLILNGSYNRINIQDLETGLFIVRIRYGSTVISKSLIIN
jgi:hypothetical protein